MGAKTKEVGGGSARIPAMHFSSYLMRHLDDDSLMKNTMNDQLQGKVPGMDNVNQWMQQFAGGPQQAMQFNPMQFTNPYQQQQFDRPELRQHKLDVLQGNGMADLSKFGNIDNVNIDWQRGLGQQANLNPFDASQFGGNTINLLNAFAQQGGGGGGAAANRVALDPAMSYEEANSKIGNALDWSEIMRQRAVADQRSRFGAEGAGALGSGAKFAESTLNADLAARNAQNAFNMIQSVLAQDLNERMGRANVGLGSEGQQLQASIANQQAGLQNRGMNLNALQAAGQLGLGQGNLALAGRGQDLQNYLSSRGLDNQQLGLGLQQGLGNQQAQLQNQGQMLSSTLQNQGLGNQFQFQNAGLNQNALQMNNQNAMALSQMLNNFNLQNALNSAQLGLGTNQLNSQNNLTTNQQNLQGNQQAWTQNMDILNNLLNQAGLSGNMQNSAMGRLWQSLMQTQALGTPQAQILGMPSTFSQIWNPLMQLGGLYVAGGGRFPGQGGGSTGGAG